MTYNGKDFSQFVVERTAAYVDQVGSALQVYGVHRADEQLLTLASSYGRVDSMHSAIAKGTPCLNSNMFSVTVAVAPAV